MSDVTRIGPMDYGVVHGEISHHEAGSREINPGQVNPALPVSRTGEEKTDAKVLGELAARANASLRGFTSLNFQVDEQTKKLVVKVVDADTKETVRQIPSEEMLEVAKRIKDLEGILFDTVV
ncbi:MAG: flagellar protein FlaG [Magnetococcales bacterium]|nr:flagellar protein FlaG [Magnetococcales bacterium]